MNEDLKPLYDIESNWELIGGQKGIQVFEHKEYHHLLRLINYKEQTITFTDRLRLSPERIIDINKSLDFKRKAKLQLLAYRVLDAEKPVTMPYIPEKLKVYVEDLDSYVGILYFMDSDEKKTVKPIKRYFFEDVENRMMFTEVSQDEYINFKMKEEITNADNGSNKAGNSKP